jgi:hypothetical protein
MYNPWNPIHKIKGKKTIENENIINKFSNNQEQKKRILLMLLMYIIPFVYIYLCLIITTNFETFHLDNRLVIYIPSILIFFYIKYLRIIHERNLIIICKERSKSKTNIKDK